jgi:hypothetical protein
MIMAISACPMTVAQILDLATKIEKDEFKIDDLVDGLMDFNEALDCARGRRRRSRSGRRRRRRGRDRRENLERLKVAALVRFATIRKLHARMLAVLQKDGHKAPKYIELQKKVQNELMQIRFSARQVEKLCDSVRSEVDNIRRSSARSRTSSSTRAACRVRTSSRSSRRAKRRCVGSTARSRRTTTTASSSPSTGRPSSSSSRSCSTCKRA